PCGRRHGLGGGPSGVWLVCCGGGSREPRGRRFPYTTLCRSRQHGCAVYFVDDDGEGVGRAQDWRAVVGDDGGEEVGAGSLGFGGGRGGTAVDCGHGGGDDAGGRSDEQSVGQSVSEEVGTGGG